MRNRCSSEKWEEGDGEAGGEYGGDGTKIYIFHGKRFVCAKIEVEIKDDGIEPIMTGSFYMIS